jgi:hypothetical protein
MQQVPNEGNRKKTDTFEAFNKKGKEKREEGRRKEEKRSSWPTRILQKYYIY